MPGVSMPLSPADRSEGRRPLWITKSRRVTLLIILGCGGYICCNYKILTPAQRPISPSRSLSSNKAYDALGKAFSCRVSGKIEKEQYRSPQPKFAADGGDWLSNFHVEAQFPRLDPSLLPYVSHTTVEERCR